MKKNIINQTKWAMAILCLCIYSSCIEEIDLILPEDQTNGVAIEGRIVLADPSYIEVFVTNVFDFSTESRVPLESKSVMVFDEEGNSMSLQSTSIGDYYSIIDETSPIQVEYGKAYKIEVVTFDNKKFESEYDVLSDALPADELSLDIIDKLVINNLGDYEIQDRLQLSLSTDVDKTLAPGVLIEVNSTFKITDSPIDDVAKTCYVTNRVNRDDVLFIDVAEIATSRLQNKALIDINVDYRFNEGYYFNVGQYALSEKATKYWSQVNTINEYSGNIFDDPLGKVVTNITNVSFPDQEAFGFFYATSEDIIRIKVGEEFIEDDLPYCPEFIMTMRDCPLAPICCDCLNEDISTLTIPSYWE